MAEAVQSHRDLIVWQKAMDFAVLAYKCTERLPASENFRLVSQITRAAASVPANIAEGFSRQTSRDYAYFLSIAKGSLMEAETLLTLAVRLGYLTEEQLQPVLGVITEIEKMLSVLRKRILARV
ncbi:MAG TPA: four helix bundle protein [Chloroflexota bacterium]